MYYKNNDNKKKILKQYSGLKIQSNKSQKQINQRINNRQISKQKQYSVKEQSYIKYQHEQNIAQVTEQSIKNQSKSIKQQYFCYIKNTIKEVQRLKFQTAKYCKDDVQKKDFQFIFDGYYFKQLRNITVNIHQQNNEIINNIENGNFNLQNRINNLIQYLEKMVINAKAFGDMVQSKYKIYFLFKNLSIFFQKLVETPERMLGLLKKNNIEVISRLLKLQQIKEKARLNLKQTIVKIQHNQKIEMNKSNQLQKLQLIKIIQQLNSQRQSVRQSLQSQFKRQLQQQIRQKTTQFQKTQSQLLLNHDRAILDLNKKSQQEKQQLKSRYEKILQQKNNQLTIVRHQYQISMVEIDKLKIQQKQIITLNDQKNQLSNQMSKLAQNKNKLEIQINLMRQKLDQKQNLNISLNQLTTKLKQQIKMLEQQIKMYDLSNRKVQQLCDMIHQLQQKIKVVSQVNTKKQKIIQLLGSERQILLEQCKLQIQKLKNSNRDIKQIGFIF